MRTNPDVMNLINDATAHDDGQDMGVGGVAATNVNPQVANLINDALEREQHGGHGYPEFNSSMLGEGSESIFLRPDSPFANTRQERQGLDERMRREDPMHPSRVTVAPPPRPRVSPSVLALIGDAVEDGDDETWDPAAEFNAPIAESDDEDGNDEEGEEEEEGDDEEGEEELDEGKAAKAIAGLSAAAGAAAGGAAYKKSLEGKKGAERKAAKLGAAEKALRSGFKTAAKTAAATTTALAAKKAADAAKKRKAAKSAQKPMSESTEPKLAQEGFLGFAQKAVIGMTGDLSEKSPVPSAPDDDPYGRMTPQQGKKTIIHKSKGEKGSYGMRKHEPVGKVGGSTDALSGGKKPEESPYRRVGKPAKGQSLLREPKHGEKGSYKPAKHPPVGSKAGSADPYSGGKKKDDIAYRKVGKPSSGLLVRKPTGNVNESLKRSFAFLHNVLERASAVLDGMLYESALPTPEEVDAHVRVIEEGLGSALRSGMGKMMGGLKSALGMVWDKAKAAKDAAVALLDAIRPLDRLFNAYRTIRGESLERAAEDTNHAAEIATLIEFIGELVEDPELGVVEARVATHLLATADGYLIEFEQASLTEAAMAGAQSRVQGFIAGMRDTLGRLWDKLAAKMAGLKSKVMRTARELADPIARQAMKDDARARRAYEKKRKAAEKEVKAAQKDFMRQADATAKKFRKAQKDAEKEAAAAQKRLDRLEGELAAARADSQFSQAALDDLEAYYAEQQAKLAEYQATAQRLLDMLQGNMQNSAVFGDLDESYDYADEEPFSTDANFPARSDDPYPNYLPYGPGDDGREHLPYSRSDIRGKPVAGPMRYHNGGAMADPYRDKRKDRGWPKYGMMYGAQDGLHTSGDVFESYLEALAEKKQSRRQRELESNKRAMRAGAKANRAGLKGAAIGTAVGTAAGAVGGPAGAIVGAGIGSAVGDAVARKRSLHKSGYRKSKEFGTYVHKKDWKELHGKKYQSRKRKRASKKESLADLYASSGMLETPSINDAYFADVCPECDGTARIPCPTCGEPPARVY